MLVDSVSQHLTNTQNSQQASIDLKQAYSQLQLHKNTAKLCMLNVICGGFKRSSRFKTAFFASRTCQLNFKKQLNFKISAEFRITIF